MKSLNIQVCYALPGQEWLRSMEVQQGTTLLKAVEISGLLDAYPEVDLSNVQVGIYGKLKTLETVLRDQDRIEVYRALLADPKESRRRRATTRARRQKR